MTKIEMAKMLTESPAWDGMKDPYKLAKIYSKDELDEAYEELESAEADYYNSIYYGN